MPQFSTVRGQFGYIEVRLCRPERLSRHVGRGLDKHDRDLHVAPTDYLRYIACKVFAWGCSGRVRINNVGGHCENWLRER